MIEITDYNPQWKNDFDKLKKFYLNNIKGVPLIIEHVGSTSVEELCAKPIIDIVIVHHNMNDFVVIKKCLENLGYCHRGDLGITNREAFKYQGNILFPKHHLYVCLDGILALENQINFRNYLIKYPQKAKEYGKLKMELAKLHENDINKYCEAKTNFILNVLRKCEFSEEALQEIKEMNRI